MKKLRLTALAALSVLAVAAFAAPATVCVQFKNDAQYIDYFTVQAINGSSAATTVEKGQTSAFLPFQTDGNSPAIKLVSGVYPSYFDVTENGVSFDYGVLYPQSVAARGKQTCGGATHVAYKVDVIREY